MNKAAETILSVTNMSAVRITVHDVSRWGGLLRVLTDMKIDIKL
jgi:hypothetical protein